MHLYIRTQSVRKASYWWRHRLEQKRSYLQDRLALKLGDGGREALALYGTPEIFNTDQGSQFTATAFIKVLLDAKVTLSMDGVGRAIDNVFIERLWRTIKYDHIYLNPTDSGKALRDGLATFIAYYNEDRPHSALGDATPDEVYHRSQLQQRAA